MPRRRRLSPRTTGAHLKRSNRLRTSQIREPRAARFSRLVAGVDGVVLSEAIEAEGAVVFAKACEMGLEGIVSKRAGSHYRSGTSRSWLKSKNPAFLRE